MKVRLLAWLALATLLSVAVVAQYQLATRYQYTTPRVVYYPTSQCVMVDVDQKSPTCYRDGVNACASTNGGYCYRNCVQHVRNICFDTLRIPSSQLPVNVELQFKSRGDCKKAIWDWCSQWSGSAFYDCVTRGNTRCSYIGRMIV